MIINGFIPATCIERSNGSSRAISKSPTTPPNLFIANCLVFTELSTSGFLHSICYWYNAVYTVTPFLPNQCSVIHSFPTITWLASTSHDLWRASPLWE